MNLPDKMEAVWTAPHLRKEKFPPPESDVRVDVAIIGGGITGLSCAHTLSREGYRVAVFEAKCIGESTTGLSTGNLYTTIDERLFSISSKHDKKALKAVVEARSQAIDFIEERVREFDISCSFERVPFHLFSDPGGETAEEVRREAEAAREAGLTVSGDLPAGFPFKAGEVMTLPDQAQFNPLTYIIGLAEGLESDTCRIYEHTRVTSITDGEPCRLETEHGRVEARFIIQATHSPKGRYGVHLAMGSYREFAVAARLHQELPANGIYWQTKKDMQYSIRPYHTDDDDYLVALGESHKVGHAREAEEEIRDLTEYLREHFQVEDLSYLWAAQNYRPVDHLPYIGRSLTESNVFIATGFAADGLVWGTVAAAILPELIRRNEHPWASFFDPRRFTPVASMKKLLKEASSATKHLVKDHLFYGEADALRDIPKGEGRTIELENEKVAAYRDEQDELHVVSSVCPHMGCVVHWNSREKSWDCPCHGSRFSVDGEVLEGPALEDLGKARQ